MANARGCNPRYPGSIPGRNSNYPSIGGHNRRLEDRGVASAPGKTPGSLNAKNTIGLEFMVAVANWLTRRVVIPL